MLCVHMNIVATLHLDALHQSIVMHGVVRHGLNKFSSLLGDTELLSCVTNLLQVSTGALISVGSHCISTVH